MLVSKADSRELKRRAQAMHDHEAIELAELVRAGCITAILQLLSDGVAAYRDCPAGRCRRKRRCIGLPFHCTPIMCARELAGDPVRMSDTLFWLVMQALVDEDEGRAEGEG